MNFFLRALTLFVLSTSLLGCAGGYTYKKANDLPIDEVCNNGTFEGELLMSDDCGLRLVRMTGEAACRAGDATGCTVAAAMTFGQSVGSSSLRNPRQSRGEQRRATKFAQRGCTLGSDSACWFHSLMLLRSGNRASQVQGVRQLESQCQSGSGLSCLTLGQLIRELATTDAEKQRAVELLTKSCEADYADGCLELARIHQEGFGVTASATKAKELFEEACDLQSLAACEEIGRNPPAVDDELLTPEAELDTPKFVEMARVACDDGFRHACTLTGRLIDRGELRGRYVDAEMATEFFQMGCEKGAMESCYYLAINTHAGRGTEANTKTAATYADQACSNGLEVACELHRDLRFRLFDENEALAHAKRCDGGDAKACYLAGQAFHYDTNFPKQPQKSLSLHRKGCDLNYADACEVAGVLQEELDEDHAAANELYEKACELGGELGCFKLGLNIASGKGAEEDAQRAVSYLNKACAGGSSDACGVAANFHKTGVGTDRDLTRAEEMYRTGCAGGHIHSCTELALLLEESGTRESVKAAAALYQVSCQNDDPRACNRLGQWQWSDDAEAPSNENAADHFERACLLEHQPACANLGRLYLRGAGVEKSRERGLELLQSACSEDHPAGCAQLGSLYDAGEVLPDDSAKALKWYDRGCELEDPTGCRNAGWSRLYDPDFAYEPERGLQDYASACEAGDDSACVFAAGGWSHGIHVERSYEKAVKLLTTGCEAGGSNSCDKLADFQYLGMGTAKDAEAAASSADQSIDSGTKACMDYGGWTCADVAHQIAHGHGPENRDLKRAQAFLDARCEEGKVWACHERAEQTVTGELYPRDRPEAIDALHKLCDDGHTAACVDLAFFYRSGDDDEIDLAQSLDQYEELCEAEHESSCAFAGFAHLTGRGTQVDLREARALLPESCDEETRTGCPAYVQMLISEDGDDALASELADEARARCERGQPNACIQLAEHRAHGFGAEQGIDGAVEALKGACKAGDGAACAKAELLDTHARKLSRHDRTCEEGEKKQCVIAGLASEYGASPSPKQAAAAYEQACRLGSADGCRLLFALHYHWKWPLDGSGLRSTAQAGCSQEHPEFCMTAGKVVAGYDWDRGTELVASACAAGLERACFWTISNGIAVSE